MNNYILYYDSDCPICSTLVKVLKSKLPGNRITFAPLPQTEEVNEIRLSESDTGIVYTGTDAIEKLRGVFPAMDSYFWMIPKALRGGALQASYKAVSKVRKVYKKTTKSHGCNCGH